MYTFIFVQSSSMVLSASSVESRNSFLNVSPRSRKCLANTILLLACNKIILIDWCLISNLAGPRWLTELGSWIT